MTTEASTKIVCDAGPIIYLDELDCLELLVDFDEVLVPEQVWNEVLAHRPTALNKPNLPFLKAGIAVSSQAHFAAVVKSLALDFGEQAALTLMLENPHVLFLTDDAAARLAAISLGFRVHGSIGILIRAIRRQQKDREEVLAILRALPAQSTLYVRPALLNEIITQVESQTTV